MFSCGAKPCEREKHIVVIKNNRPRWERYQQKSRNVYLKKTLCHRNQCECTTLSTQEEHIKVVDNTKVGEHKAKENVANLNIFVS
jgi:hypothetical protein